MKSSINSKISSLELFNNVHKNTIEELSNIAECKNYIKGSHIFRDKEMVNKLYIVYSGKVSLYKLTESAQKKVIFILGKNKIVNAVILDDLQSSINCEVFEDAEILSFDKVKLERIMKKDFELTKVIIRSLSIKVRRLYRQLKNTTPIKVEKKVAAKLWKLSKDYGKEVEEGTLIDLNITITYLSDMFGTSRETISRALKILQEKNLIIYKKRKIIIINKDEMLKFFKGITD